MTQSMMPVRTPFPEPKQPRTGPLGWSEPAVHWFTDSTRPEAVASRDAVNSWYAEFPDRDAKFAARLTSEVDVDHYQALDELYVYHLLCQRHGDVRYEEGGIGPDFRIYDDGTLVGAVEVLSLFQREDWHAEQALHSRLATELNKRVRPTDGYFVDFEIEHAEPEPAPRRIADWIRVQLAGLPPHDQLDLPADVRRADLPTRLYDRDGVRIQATFIPMRKDAPAKSDPDGRIVGMGPAIGGMVNSGAWLKDRIEAKAGGRYQIGEVPFLVAASVHDLFCGDVEFITAVYGSDAVDLRTGELVRNPDGLFGTNPQGGRSRHRRISAVAVISNLRVWEAQTADVAVLHNPNAARPWPDNALLATRRFGHVATAGGDMLLAL